MKVSEGMKVSEVINRLKKAQKEGLEACLSLIRDIDPDLAKDLKIFTEEDLKTYSLLSTFVFGGLAGAELKVSEEIIKLIERYERILAEQVCFKNYYMYRRR